MKRRIFIFGIVALIVSLAASSLWAPSYEESLLKVELQEQGLLSERVADAPTAHQQLLARHGMKAFLAAEQYPEMAPALYALYEQVEYEGKPLLTTVIDANGYERVVPAVWYFVQNENLSQTFGENFSQCLQQIGEAVPSSFEGVTEKLPRKLQDVGNALAGLLTSATSAVANIANSDCTSWDEIGEYDRGLLALVAIHNDPSLLHEFVIGAEGKVERLQGKRIMRNIGNFFVGGMLEVERKLVVGEDVGFLDWAIAGSEVAVIGYGFTRAAQLARASKYAKVAKVAKTPKGAKAARAITAARALAPTLVKGGVVAGVGYVLVKHPTLIPQGIGYALEQALGIPSWLTQGVLWAVIATMLVLLVRPVWILIAGAGRLMRSLV
jgi:hypothetical protein